MRADNTSLTLKALLVLFALRVAAQPIAAITSTSWLPRFDAFQSGVVPYWLLVVAQVPILIAMVASVRQVAAGRARLSKAGGRAVIAIGAIYFTAMVLRLSLGSTILRGDPWFDKPIPTFFHAVVASYLLVYGRYQWRYGASA